MVTKTTCVVNMLEIYHTFLTIRPLYIHVVKMGEKSNRITAPASRSLKSRLEQYAEQNEISQSGAVRMILNQNLPSEE